MLRRIKIRLAYDGTAYAGWQIQKGQSHVQTIQGTIEQGLSLITKTPRVTIVGAGRTDAGVHARGQVFHFDTASQIPPDRFPSALNSVLPRDIRCLHGEMVPLTFHAQRAAKEKTYSYLIDHGRVADVFLRHYAEHVPGTLDWPAMQKAAGHLLGQHDFRSFCASGSSVKTFERTIKNLELKKQGSLIYVNISADGFLYNMVRIIVGTLIDVGRGKMAAAALPAIVAGKDRSLAGPTAAAKGLRLEKVVY